MEESREAQEMSADKEKQEYQDYLDYQDYAAQEEPGLISKPITGGLGKLSMLGELGQLYESVLPAPSRSAVQALKKGEGLGGATSAFGQQILKDPAEAPTGEDLIGYHGPGGKVAGFVTEMAVDPLNIPMAVSALKGAKAIVPLSKMAMETSNELALKGAGAMKGAFKELGKKDMIQSLGKYVKEMGFLKAGDTVEDVARKSSESLSKTGNKLGDLYGKIKETIPGSDVVNKAMKDLEAKFGPGGTMDSPIAHQRSMELVMKEMEPFIGKDMTATQLHNTRIFLDKKIKNWARTPPEFPESQQAILNVRNSINDILNQMANKVAAPDELKRLNKEYSMTSKVNQIASDRVAANQTNRAFSLTDYMTGLGTGTGYLASHPDQIGTSLLVGLAGAGANKIARKIGPGGVASGLDMISGPLKFTDPLTNLLRQRPTAVFGGALKAGQGEAAYKRRLKALE